MRGDQHHAERDHQPVRQIDQRRKHDHRAAQRAQHEDHGDAVIEVELPAQTPQRYQFHEDQPQPAGKQEARQLAFGLTAECEIRSCPREQKENWRTEMRDPACEEQRHRRGRKVGGTGARVSEEIADVVDRHQHHYRSAHQVDRLNASPLRSHGDGGCCHEARSVTNAASAVAVIIGPRIMTKYCYARIVCADSRSALRHSMEEGSHRRTYRTGAAHRLSRR